MEPDIPRDIGSTGTDAATVVAEPATEEKERSLVTLEATADGSHSSKEDRDDNASVQSELSQESTHDGLHNDMLQALDSITSSGTFAAAHKLGEIFPGLVVEDVGPVDLPLQEGQAQQMIAKARQAPFGKGSETIVDTSVRNTWELDPAQFQLTNHHWPTFVSELCQAISTEAGLGAARVRADLYKMLIYEKGAMFKAHQDTEKIPNMFGTLVICLPSPHQGGNVVTKHRGRSKIFMTDNTPQSYIWWFSDVSHEVLPVISGYRVVLTYNLATDSSLPTLRPSAALARSEARPLRHALQRWLTQPKQKREAPYLYYGLDHQYTQGNISHRGLKTRDLAVVDILQQLSAALPFHVFLAVLEKEQSGSCEDTRDYNRGSGYDRGEWDGYFDDDDEEEEEEDDEDFHDLEDIFDTSYRIQSLVDLGGRELGMETSFDLDNVVQGEYDLFPEDPEDEDYVGFKGNSGPSATHWYRASAVVIVPRDHLVDYLSSASQLSSLQSVTEYIAEACLEVFESERGSALDIWNAFYEEIFNERGGMTKATPETKELVLLATLMMRDWGLWNDLITSMAGDKHDLPNHFFFEVCEEILMSELTFGEIEEGMTTLVTVLPTLARQYEAISLFVDLDAHGHNEINDDLRILMEAWARQACTRVLAEDRSLGWKDGLAIVNIAFERFDLAFFKEVTVPIFEKRIKDFGFSFGYLNHFRTYITADDKDLNHDEGKTLYKCLATFLVENIDASLLHSHQGLEARVAAAKPIHNSYMFPSRMQRDDPSLQADPLDTVDYGVLLVFIKGILMADMPLPTVQKLFFKLTDQAGRIHATEFHPLWLPFLRGFVRVLERCSVPVTAPRYRHFYAAVLEAYIQNYVGKEPTDTSSLVQPSVSCHCRDCEALNAFLTNPHRKVDRFPVGKERRQHLHQQLEYAGIDCTHKTERYGNPQTLVVTKNFTQQVQTRTVWKARAEAAMEQFELFDPDHLRTLLGHDYSKIVGLVDVRAVPNQQDAPPNISRQPPQGQVQPSTQPPPSAQPKQVVQIHHHGLPPNLPRSSLHPQPNPAARPYQSPYSQSGFTARQGQPPQPKLQLPPGVKEVGFFPNATRPQPTTGPQFGVLTPASGNQPHRQGRAFPKLESPGSGAVGIKQETGKKRKASEIEPEIIDLTGDD
ncbi:hypothetical protein CONLIGDRAFT_685690 [Coniochaeta ligniaria NRRL 30616]|uniref:Uncharacterized protein n=1 Tax=Coniochaeta ligniaria NRRL 30616 TaxID=1408157 RepID=A0A1J7IAP6_9PEZI|nr:hypothetical protein CONLIGDRAFT_685690 [Coniochaeta ligniaria NRRL 30616]